MPNFKTIATRVLLVAGPVAFLVIETAGKFHP
jgi:hypothetical protein